MAGVQIKILSHLITCYHRAMNWFRWTSDRNSILGVVFAVLMIGAALLASVVHFSNGGLRRTNWGFGPDWECTAQAKGEPTCIKKLGR
jgi:hypothetical protein